MGDLNHPTTIAQRMRARGKSDDMIRDTLRTWDLADPEIDDILAHLDPAPAGAAPTPPANTNYAVTLAARMRQDGRADDLIRDALRACDIADADIDQILADAPPTGTPVRHQMSEHEVEEAGFFHKYFRWIIGPFSH